MKTTLIAKMMFNSFIVATVLIVINTETMVEKIYIKLKEMGNKYKSEMEELKQLNHEQRVLNDNLTSVIEEASLRSVLNEQRRVLETTNQTVDDLIADVAKYKNRTDVLEVNLAGVTRRMYTMENDVTLLKTEVFFTVTLASSQTFEGCEIIKFDSILTNYGNGYIESGTDHGKFIVPYKGTYTFTVTVRNKHTATGTFTRATITKIWSGGQEILCDVIGGNEELETGMCSVVVKLSVGDVIMVWNTNNVSGYYHLAYTAFSGYLVKRDG